MKKILSLILSFMLVFSGATIWAEPLQEYPETAVRGDGLELAPAELTIPMFSVYSGERLRVFDDGQLAPGEYFEWASSDTSVVAVSSNGFLTAVAPGSALVTVYDTDGRTAQCSVTVVEDSEFPTMNEVSYTDIDLPYYSEEVGIGPLGGGEHIIVKRFSRPPSCSNDDPVDPNAYIPEEGWICTYATVFRVHASYGQTISFSTAPSQASGAHAGGAYLTLVDRYFYVWDFDSGTSANPYGEITMTSYEDSYFYLVITPISHTADSGSGQVYLYVYDATAPLAPGDVDCDSSVTMADVTMLAMYLNGEDPYIAERGMLAADANLDGFIDIRDIAAVYSIIAQS